MRFSERFARRCLASRRGARGGRVASAENRKRRRWRGKSLRAPEKSHAACGGPERSSSLTSKSNPSLKAKSSAIVAVIRASGPRLRLCRTTNAEWASGGGGEEGNRRAPRATRSSFVAGAGSTWQIPRETGNKRGGLGIRAIPGTGTTLAHFRFSVRVANQIIYRDHLETRNFGQRHRRGTSTFLFG